jgi:uncharacterized protein YigE (DUF2233 family)
MSLRHAIIASPLVIAFLALGTFPAGAQIQAPGAAQMRSRLGGSRPLKALSDDARALEANGVRFEMRQFRGVSYTVAWVDPKKADLQLRWKDANQQPLGTLEGARAEAIAGGSRFFMATNSGIYDRAFKPLGLHVEKGQMLRPLNRSHASTGNFFMNPNGVFFVSADGTPGILESAAYTKAAPAPAFAAQSGPLLAQNKELHPAFREGSANTKLRSGVGVDESGRAAFAISSGAVNFYDFALFFRDELGCPNALYLDGEISSMLRDGEQSIQLAEFAGIWTATSRLERPAASKK